MPCSNCHKDIKGHNNYYNSNSIVNNFLCKLCNKCMICHINSNDHLIEQDKDNFDYEDDTKIQQTKVHDVFKENWR